MKVALHAHHHHLPGWSSPQNPQSLFDPEDMKYWPAKYGSGYVKLSDHIFWPILMALHQMQLPLLAHMALPIEVQPSIEGQPRSPRFEWCKRNWVQISTRSPEDDARGVPAIIDTNGRLLVRCLWAGDHAPHVYSPFDLLSDAKRAALKGLKGEEKTRFWTIFFHERLVAAKLAAEEEIAAAERKVRESVTAYAMFPAL